jgi:YHS domain-containing protein
MRRALLVPALAVPIAFLLAACGSTGSGGSPPVGGAPRASSGPTPYPLDTCLVTGTKLGSMGDPITKVYGGREIRFCCEPCVAEFEADPERFLKLLPR